MQVFEVAPALLGLAAANEIAESEDHGVADGVEDRGAVAAAADEAGVMQDSEVLGDVGLVALQLLDEFADGHLAAREEMKDAEADGLAEGAKSSRHECHHFFTHARTLHELYISPYGNIVKGIDKESSHANQID